MAQSPDNSPALGAEIRRLRESMGMTLVAFARLTGVPFQTLQAYETGRTVPPADRFLRLVHACRRAPEPFRFDHVARALAQAA